MGSMLYDRESCEATRLHGQNVRGLTPLKLEETVQFMKDREILVSCLMETWRETKDGVECEELDGYLIIHHGESKQSGKNRARNGVAIILAPKARAAWEQGGSKVRHSANGRVLTVLLPLGEKRTHTVGVAYSPVSGKSSAERQSFYDDIATQTRSDNPRDILTVFIDANASPGVGVHARDRPPGAPSSLGPYGKRLVNSAGQEFREFLQSENLASATTFFQTKGWHYATWYHPVSGKGYQIDHVLVRRNQLGRVLNARVCPEIMVASDHFPVFMEMRIGRMQRKQAPAGPKPANILALRDAEVRKAFAEIVASTVLAWETVNPGAELEERAKALRELLHAAAIEACGPRGRREEGWFVRGREAIMACVRERNRAEAAYRKSGDKAAAAVAKAKAKAELQTARKKTKRVTEKAKQDYFEAKVNEAKGGVGSFWESVREINSMDSRAQAVATQKFNNPEGDECKTPAENAAVAAAHFTGVYNNVREAHPGAAEAIASVRQRQVRDELDATISLAELEAVLQKAKPGKATSNQTPVELLQACSANPEAFALLHRLVSDIFEDERASPPPPPEPPPPEPPPALAEPRPSSMVLIVGAKKHGWRLQWQQENPKLAGCMSAARYTAYCAATTHAEALVLGATASDLRWDLDHGYLQIFPGSLRTAPHPAEGTAEGDGEGETAAAAAVTSEVEASGAAAAAATTAPAVTALLDEFARMRLKLLPKKGDLRNLNNWRGIMLLDAASKIISMVINNRLQQLLKEEGIEEQNGFSGGRGCADGSFCIRQALKKRREHGQESWVLFVDLVKAFDSVPRDVLFTVLAKFGVPPHLLRVIKRTNADLQVAFELGSEPVAVPCTVGVKQGCPLSPTLFLFVMQACLETLEKAMPEDSKLQFQTDTRVGERGGKVSGTDWTNQGEFTFSFWASLYADDAAIPLASRAALLAATNATYDHLRKFGLLMHVGSDGKRSKTEAMYCPARNEDYGDGDTSDLVLDCGGTVSFTEKFVYLGSLLHRDLTDKHDVDARIKKASQAFGALRDKIFSSASVPERLKGKLYAGGVLSVLLYGCESWCLTEASVSRLSSWHNKRIREMCRITMRQTYIHRISSKSLQQRTGVFELEHYLASRTLLWVGHVARMPKSRLPKRLMLSWVRAPRVTGGQEMTYGRSLERHLKRFGLPLAYTEWAHIAQNRADWHKRVAQPPFAIGKPFVRRPRGDTRRTPEQKREDEARHAAEAAERRAVFDANDNDEGWA